MTSSCETLEGVADVYRAGTDGSVVVAAVVEIVLLSDRTIHVSWVISGACMEKLQQD